MHSQSIIKQLYAAFNERRTDDVLCQMTETVSWPKASEGGRVVGKDEIRNYWIRQWTEFDPNVEPLEIMERQHNKFAVRVHQIVKNLKGELLSDGEVWHIFSFANGLIERMDIEEEGITEQAGRSSAFSHKNK